MRGSAWVVIKVWIVNRDGSIRESSLHGNPYYGHSAVGDMSTQRERNDGYTRATNQALKQYRNEHHIGSETEINYKHIKSGITNITINDKGKHIKKVYSNRINGNTKRTLHKLMNLGGEKSELSRKEYNEMFAKKQEELKEQTAYDYSQLEKFGYKRGTFKEDKMTKYKKSRSTAPSVERYRKEKRS